MNALAQTIAAPYSAHTIPVSTIPGLRMANLTAPAMPSGFETELLVEEWSAMTGERVELTSASDLPALSILGTL